MRATVIDTPPHVRRPDGTILTWADLPEAGTMRWTPQRKRLVVEAMVYGLTDAETLLQRYNISAEELREWFVATRRIAEGMPPARRAQR